MSFFFFTEGLITMVSMLVYGLGYLPLILGISLESPIGYLAAIPFSWIFTAEFFTCSICRQKNTVSMYCKVNCINYNT